MVAVASSSPRQGGAWNLSKDLLFSDNEQAGSACSGDRQGCTPTYQRTPEREIPISSPILRGYVWVIIPKECVVVDLGDFF